MPRRLPQLEPFAPPAGRKRRAGAKRGRKARIERAGLIPHRTRPAHDSRHPVHVSMKRIRLAPSFRTEVVSRLIVAKIARLKAKAVRVIHYSIQHDHLHLMAEGEDAKDLSRKLQLLFSSIALAVNRLVGRRGSLFRDRHHRHELKTPTETRRALVYIFFNERKHAASDGWFDAAALEWLDRHSSAGWFDGWHPDARPPPRLVVAAQKTAGSCPLTAPQTWLAQKGWQRAGGPLRFEELPRLWR